jgi:uncharacterized protein with GYD domain
MDYLVPAGAAPPRPGRGGVSPSSRQAACEGPYAAAAVDSEEWFMATYVVLVNFTDQGIRSVGESPKRYEAFKALAEKMEVRLKEIWWTIGAYDIVTTIEGSEEAVTAALLKLGSAGNVRTQTLRAWAPDEFGRILKKATS